MYIKRLLKIGAVTLLGISLTYTVAYFYIIKMSSEMTDVNIRTGEQLYMVDSLTQIEQIEWQDNEMVILVAAGKLFQLDTASRSLNQIAEIGDGSRIGFEDGQLVICQFVNFEITDPSQHSTEINIMNAQQEEVLRIQLFETVRPESCSTSRLLVQNSYHGAPEKFFLYENGVLTETEPVQPQIVLSGIEKTLVSDAKGSEIMLIPHFNIFITGELAPNHKSIALLADDGTLWIYQTR